MAKKVQIVDSDVVNPALKRKSPAQIIIDGLEGDYKTMREVAELMGVHTETLRRLARATNPDGTKKIKAPSKAAQTGGMTIYLFTPEDVQEVQEHFEKKGYVIET